MIKPEKRDEIIRAAMELVAEHGIIEYFIAMPMEFRFMEQFFNSPFGVAHRREKLFGNPEKSLIFKLFEEALAQRIVKDLPPPVLCALAFGLLVDVCRDHLLEFIVLDDTLIEQIATACRDGLKR